MSTDQTPATPHDVAVELLALTALIDRAQSRVAELKADQVAAWEPGSKLVLNLPGARPNTFRKVGEVRQDGGATVAVVRDRPAWEQWCRDHAAHNVLRSLESRTGWRLDGPSTEALLEAMHAGRGVAAAGDDPWADPDPLAVAAAMLRVLEAAGFTLTPVEVTPEAEQVAPAWETAVLIASKDAGTPVTPDGEVPDGIAVTTAEPRPVVVLTAKKQPEMVDEWIRTVRLPALLPANQEEQQ